MRKFVVLLYVAMSLHVLMVSSLAEDDLPTVVLTDFENDRHRQEHDVEEVIRIAYRLAEVGAGYEAARVLATIALWERDRDSRNEATHLLNEWGLTIETIRQGNVKDITAKVESVMRHRRGSNTKLRHVRNLIALGLYVDAARLLHQDIMQMSESMIERAWGEFLHRYRLSVELLRSDAEDISNKLVNALQTVHQQNRLRIQVRALRAIDREVSEMAEGLIWHVARKSDENDDEDRRPFERWVIHRDEEWGEDEHIPSVEELVPRVLHRGINLAKRSKPSARLLAMLVMEASPESEFADKASSLIEMLAEPATNTLLPAHFFEDDSDTELFGAERVREYHLELSDDAIKQLHEKPKHYVRATFHEGNDVYKNVGVRLKGGYGSFRMLDGNSKAAFTVKFNQFVKGQRFHGLRRIILNNVVQDPSYMCEYIGYSLFRDAGVPAPRIGYANLLVNKKPYGLYVQVEAVTKDFLQRWYAKTSGNLYEGPGDIERWDELDLDSNQGREDRSDLRRLAEAIKEADDNDPWDSLAEFVDIDNFTRFIALEQLLHHWDGYTQTNNYRMYKNPDTMKFEFFPHGADQLFEDLRGHIFREQGGILSRALMYTSAGKERYSQMMYQLLEQVWDEDTIKSRIAKIYQLIRPHVMKSTKGRRIEEFENAINRLLRFVDSRRYVVLRQLKVVEKENSWRERQHFGFHSFLYSSRHGW